MLRAGNLLSAGVLNIFCTMMAIKNTAGAGDLWLWFPRSQVFVCSQGAKTTGLNNTHTCSEISYRIVDVECIGRAKNTPVKPNRRNEKKNKWDYSGHQLRLKCAQVRHHSPAGTFTRVPGRCLPWSPTPPGPR